MGPQWPKSGLVRGMRAAKCRARPYRHFVSGVAARALIMRRASRSREVLLGVTICFAQIPESVAFAFMAPRARAHARARDRRMGATLGARVFVVLSGVGRHFGRRGVRRGTVGGVAGLCGSMRDLQPAWRGSCCAARCAWPARAGLIGTAALGTVPRPRSQHRLRHRCVGVHGRRGGQAGRPPNQLCGRARSPLEIGGRFALLAYVGWQAPRRVESATVGAAETTGTASRARGAAATSWQGCRARVPETGAAPLGSSRLLAGRSFSVVPSLLGRRGPAVLRVSARRQPARPCAPPFVWARGVHGPTWIRQRERSDAPVCANLRSQRWRGAHPDPSPEASSDIPVFRNLGQPGALLCTGVPQRPIPQPNLGASASAQIHAADPGERIGARRASHQNRAQDAA